jgi:creatinine amidohydrolase
VTRRLSTFTWPEAAESAPASLLAVPLGATEQHGPHLPVSTDTLVAEALCAALAERRPEIVVGPTLPYGSSGEHAGFTGTLSIGRAALEHVVVELVRSADAFTGVVLVSGHGGNGVPLARAEQRLREEGRAVLAWWPVAGPGTDAHAGRTETSLLLLLAPDLVRAERAEPGETRPLSELAPRLERDGVRAVSANGVLGDPSHASAAEGARLLAAMVDNVDGAVTRWSTALSHNGRGQ